MLNTILKRETLSGKLPNDTMFVKKKLENAAFIAKKAAAKKASKKSAAKK